MHACVCVHVCVCVCARVCVRVCARTHPPVSHGSKNKVDFIFKVTGQITLFFKLRIF